MDALLQQKMMIIAGENVQKSQEKQLAVADKKKLSDAYIKLFIGLSFSNWLRGQTLGQAWYNALEQLKSYIATKDKNNPAAMYLNQVYAAHSTKWKQVVMTNPNKDAKIECPPELKQKWTEFAAKDTSGALSVLNGTLAQFAIKESAKTKSGLQTDYMAAQQKLQQMLMLQMRNRQNGGLAA